MYRGSGEGHFTDYLEALAVSDNPPPDQRVEAVLTALWRLIQAELRRRGLWLRQPGYLGVYGVSSWSQATQPRDVFHSEAWELVAECFRYIFLDRYAYLARQLQAGANVEGLVRRNVRNFVHDTQKKHDPLGFRVFSVLRKAALELISAGRLFVLDGDERLRNITLVGFDPAIDGPTEEEEAQIRARIAELVPVWNDQLLPDLLTAQGRGLVNLQEKVRGLFEQLPRQRVEMFRFRDLIEPIKLDVRHRWGALFDTEQGETAFEEGEEPGLLRLVQRVQPDTSLAERESFAFLLRCVDQRLAEADLSPKTRDHLEKLWQFLSLYASHPETRDIPSRRALAEQLGIPRNSMGALYDQLRELTRLCQESSDTAKEPGAADKTALKDAAMDDHETTLASLGARLNQAASRRHQRFLAEEASTRDESSRPLETGDLLRRPETAAFGVDWLVLLPEVAAAEGVWLVPVDDAPLVTPHDVDIPVSEGGPMTLRCGLALQVDPLALSREHRYGTLEPTQLEHVVASWQASRKRSDGDVTSWDPEVDFWISDAVLPARAALERTVSTSATVHPFPAARPVRQGSRAWQQRLAWAAGVLLTVTMSLLTAVIWQRSQLEDLRHRYLQSTGDAIGIYSLDRTDLPLPSLTRNLDDTIRIRVREGQLALSIEVTEAGMPYRVDLIDPARERLDQIRTVSDEHAQILLRLTGIESKTRLQLQLYRLQDGSAVRTATYDLELIAPSTE